MTDFKQGDRVIIRSEKPNRLSFLNACRGEVVRPGPHQLVDEVSVRIDGHASYYDVPSSLLMLCPTLRPTPERTCGPLCGDTTCVECVTPTPALVQSMPVDSAARKDVPVTTGVLDYFPAALAYVARVSKAGNDKHNPGEPMHWARGKSTDQADAIGRHLIDRGGTDPDTGLRHSGELAWRALALLQLELEEAGEAPLARGAYA